MLTKMVVRKVKQVTVERSFLQIAKMHVTKLHVFYEGVNRPIELLLFSDEQITIGEVQGEQSAPPRQEGWIAPQRRKGAYRGALAAKRG